MNRLNFLKAIRLTAVSLSGGSGAASTETPAAAVHDGHLRPNRRWYIKRDNPVIRDALYLSNAFEPQGYKTFGVGKLLHYGGGKGTFQEYGATMGMFDSIPSKQMLYDPVTM